MVLLFIISSIAIIGTLLPLNSCKYWFVRDQIFFRAYYLVLHSCLLVLYAFLIREFSVIPLLISVVHIICATICYRSISPYFFFKKPTIPDAESDDPGQPLKLLVYNVLHTNQEYKSFIDLAMTDNPDVILLLEPGQAWDVGIQRLYDHYPYSVKEIREDTYGIILMSRLPFIEHHLNHLISKDIPSIEVLIRLGGRRIRIYGLHPEPSVPGERLTSMPKDAELMRTAAKIVSQPNRELDILIGDLNDVGWSDVAEEFKKETGMNDPRVGRGFYSTFPTYMPFRIPIDHVFCSPDFRLIDIQTKADIGSDHYPVIVTFSIPPA